MAVHKVQEYVCIVDESGNPIGLGSSSGMFVQGPVADGGASTARPVIVGGVDGSSNAQTLLMDTSGRPLVSGALAVGAASSGANPFIIGASDGSNNAQVLRVITNQDALANSVQALTTLAEGYVFNGTTWDRARSATAAANTTGTGLLGVGAMAFDGTNYQLLRTNGSATPALRTALYDTATAIGGTTNGTDGQATAFSLNTNSFLRSWNGATWDLVRGVTGSTGMLRAQPQNSFNRITTNTTTAVKASAGTLHSIVVQKAGASSNTVTIYDNTAGSGTIIAAYTDIAVGTYTFNAAFGTGLTIVTATGTAAEFTVMYN